MCPNGDCGFELDPGPHGLVQHGLRGVHVLDWDHQWQQYLLRRPHLLCVVDERPHVRQGNIDKISTAGTLNNLVVAP